MSEIVKDDEERDVVSARLSANIHEAVTALMATLDGASVDSVMGYALRNTLANVAARLLELEAAPSFVAETATPLAAKRYEGKGYEELIKLMEYAGFLTRGTKSPWKGGAYVWEGNGMRFKEKIFGGFGKMLDGEGYAPLQTPRELPRAIIDAVCEGVVNLEEGTFWLFDQRGGEMRHSGMYANSSNDAVMSYFLADKALSGGKTLPFKGYTRHPMIRSHRDSKGTKPLVDSDENYECFEAYSIQPTSEECEAEFEEIVEMVSGYFKQMGISFFTVDQSNWGNKPVAKKVTSFQAYGGPVNGSVRLATIYMHDDTFSKLFGLGTLKEDGTMEYAHQVGYGLWEGLIVPLLDHFADEQGLCIPPDLAPIQMVFVARNEDEERRASEIIGKLDDPSKAVIDTVYRKRFNKRLHSHLKTGIPMRITFNEESGDLVVSRRDTLQSFELPSDELASSLRHIFKSMGENFASRSSEYAAAHTGHASTFSEIQDLVRQKKLVLFDHCGEDQCGMQMEQKLTGEFLGHVREFSASGCCVGCGGEGKRKGLFGRRAPNP